MALNMNRLYFPSIVHRHLKQSAVPTEIYLESLSMRRTNEENRNDIYKKNIVNSVNNIMASVHRKLKMRKPQKSVKLPPLPVDNKSEPEKCDTPKKENQKTDVKKNVLSENLTKSRTSTVSLPQLKANREQKYRQHMRRKIGQHNEANNYTVQKRAREVLRQKRVLEDMLVQHQNLRNDRKSLAIELQNMRNQLNYISDKLDSSMKKLNTQRTVVERCVRRKAVRLNNICTHTKQRKISLDRRLLN